MKVKIPKKKRPSINEKPMKRLTCNLLFRDVADLADLFEKVGQDVSRGIEQKTRDEKNGIIDFRVEYSRNHQYTERVINGQICWVFKSKA